jgi:hypothetical protein
MMSDQLIQVSPESRFLSPAATIAQAIARYALMAEFIKQVMQSDRDYGIIPGTEKPTLLKPGAEKLNSLFGLTPTFDLRDNYLDVTGAQHDGEPFIYFQYKCIIWSGDRKIAEGLGSCNSWEKKYRYRNADRKCPTCGKSTIIKGKAEYGGGWLCFARKGGCGAKFSDTDPVITDQKLGQIKNPDISDLINTLDKMAQKRALVAATLIATNASDYFTQDLDDIDPGTGAVIEGKARDVVSEPADQPAEQPAEQPNGKKIELNPKIQAIIGAGISPDVPDAAGVLNLIKGASLTIDEVVARGKLYRAWREIGSNQKQSAEKAIAGQAPS